MIERNVPSAAQILRLRLLRKQVLWVVGKTRLTIGAHVGYVTTPHETCFLPDTSREAAGRLRTTHVACVGTTSRPCDSRDSHPLKNLRFRPASQAG